MPTKDDGKCEFKDSCDVNPYSQGGVCEFCAYEFHEIWSAKLDKALQSEKFKREMPDKWNNFLIIIEHIGTDEILDIVNTLNKQEGDD